MMMKTVANCFRSMVNGFITKSNRKYILNNEQLFNPETSFTKY